MNDSIGLLLINLPTWNEISIYKSGTIKIAVLENSQEVAMNIDIIMLIVKMKKPI